MPDPYKLKNISLTIIGNHNNILNIEDLIWVSSIFYPYDTTSQFNKFKQFLIQNIMLYCDSMVIKHKLIKDVDFEKSDRGDLEPKKIEYYIWNKRVVIEYD